MKKRTRVFHGALLAGEIASKAITTANYTEGNVAGTGMFVLIKDAALAETAITNMVNDKDKAHEHTADKLALGSAIASVGGAVLYSVMKKNPVFLAVSTIGSSLADCASVMYAFDYDEKRSNVVESDVSIDTEDVLNDDDIK